MSVFKPQMIITLICVFVLNKGVAQELEKIESNQGIWLLNSNNKITTALDSAICLYHICSTKAQYGLQIGKMVLPIKTGDVISKTQLFSDTVRLVFLPNTAEKNSEIMELIVLYSGGIGKKAHATSVVGNTICPALNEIIKRKDVVLLSIIQATIAPNRIKPIGITVKLVP